VQTKKTDNSHLREKIELRKLAIESIENPKILECYAGEGTLWQKVQEETGRTLDILRIEKEKYKCPLPHLVGDNLKYLNTLDLDKFDIIDLDTYGIPAKQIQVISESGFIGILLITCCLTYKGTIPRFILNRLGYTKEMIKKIPTLFSINGLQKFSKWLYYNRIKRIEGYFFYRKIYIIAKMEEQWE